MDDDETPNGSAAERIAALNARRATGAPRSHPARGARSATLLASVVAVAGLTGGFALNAPSSSASTTVAATKTVATTNTTTAATTATTGDTNTTTAATTATTAATTTQNTTAQAVTTSQGS
jgi:hypothetical protein